MTIVANMLMWYKAMEAADILEKEGISCEIIDPRTLVPFDYETVLNSIAKTGKLMIVHEDHYNGGWGAAGLLCGRARHHLPRRADRPRGGV